MVKLVRVETLSELLREIGYATFIKELISYLKHDFSHWKDFHKIPRPAAHVKGGVIELMPIWNDQYYSYKYVNGHPCNTEIGKLTVAAIGQLSDVKTGYPLLICEMTILTAIRTAAVSVLASQLLARKNSHTLAIIGTGAQSEFQVLAHRAVLSITTVKYFDPNPQAMKKFAHNLQHLDLNLIACQSVDEAVSNSDIIISLTAAKCENKILTMQQLKPGMHINALGGDCPGKTELDAKILENAKVVIEYFEQSHVEGEIQHFTAEKAKDIVHAELAEIITKQKCGRESEDEITVFDGVGVAIEDFSTLRLVYDLCQRYQYGEEVDLIPSVADPRNLIQTLGIGDER